MIKGLKVRVVNLERGTPLLIAPAYKRHRKDGAVGVLKSPVDQHEGAWWVSHDHGTAAYWFYELEVVEDR